MLITQYICDLLYRYECVIVPEFGAFLSERTPAKLGANQQVFYPPQKRISFNQQITSNDGLLANYIASSEQISYKSALESIQVYAQELKKELDKNKRLSLSEIGFFSINFDEKLIFEPMHTTNYLSEAFGLSTFKTQEITREAKKTIVDLEEKSPVFIPEKRKKKYAFKYAAAVIGLGAGFLALKNYQTQVNDHNNLISYEVDKVVDEQLQTAGFTFEVPNPLPSISVTIKPKESITESPFKKYHIVAGAFREYTNALKSLKLLKNKGYSPFYIGQNKYKLHQVAYKSFDSKSEAIIALKKIKNTENRGAWILKAK